MDLSDFSELIEFFSNAAIPFIVAVLAAVGLLVVRILLTYAVYKDCSCIEAKNRTVWLFVVFFVPVASLIYVFARKEYVERKIPKRCLSCGADNAAEASQCVFCGATDLQNCEKPIEPSQTQRIKKAAIILTVLAVICSCVSTASMNRVRRSLIETAFEKYAAENIEDYEQYDGYKDYLWHEIKDFIKE